MLKKVLVILSIFIISLVFSTILNSSEAMAGFNIRNFNGTSGLNTTGFVSGYNASIYNNDSLENKIITIIKAALSLVGVIFLVLMLYSGFLWMTAKGDNKSVETAKENIKTALIGLIIILGAYAITNLISTTLISKMQ